MATLVKLNNNSPVFNSFFDDFLRRDLHAGYNKVAVNVKESKDAFLLEVVAPGFKKSDFTVAIEDNYLKVRAQIEAEKEENKEERYTIKEYQKSSFEKSYKLSNEVDQEKINAKYEEGILNIVIPKKTKEETNSVKSISIE